MSMNVNGSINVPFGNFGQDGVNDVSDKKLPQGGAPQANDEEIVLENPEPKGGLSAHAAFVDRLFQKAAETNRMNVTLQRNELKGACKTWKGRAAAAEAERARAQAEMAMAALDQFTGRELVEAFRAPGFEETEPGRALFNAIRTQMELADKLSACSSASGGVPALEEMSMQANLRAAELSRLMGELDQAANEKPDDARLGSTGLSSDLSRIGAESHGSRDALSHLERQLGLADLDAFTSESKDLTPEQVMQLRTKLGELKQKVEDARKNGIDFVGDGKGRTMVDPAVFKAIQAELGEMASRLDRHETKFVSAALERFADEIRPPDFVSKLDEFVKDAWKTPNKIQKAVIKDINELVKSFKEVRDGLKSLVREDLKAGRAPDKAKYTRLLARIQNLAGKADALYSRVRNESFDDLPESVANALGMDEQSSQKKNANSVVSDVLMLRYVLDEVFDVVKHWTDPETSAMSVRKDDVRALMYDGKVSLNDHVEARVHGLPDSAVDAEISGLEPTSVEPLGSGITGTVYLCTFEKEGKTIQRVFKPEIPAHYGLDRGVHSICSERLTFQTALSFNMATHKVSELLGVGKRNMQAKIGTLKGQFGMFLEVLPGASPSIIAARKKTPFSADDKLMGVFYKHNKHVLEGKVPDADAHKQKLFSLAGEVARQLNELQWLDVITGQLDRHDSNYHVSLPDDPDQKDEVRVAGLDNDASFPEDIDKAGTIVVRSEQQNAVVERFRDVIKSQTIEQYFDGWMKVDIETGNWTFNFQGMPDWKRRMLMSCTGVRSGQLPTVIGAELADKIKYLATNPEGQRQFESDLKSCGLTDRQIAAAKGRLVSANQFIRNGDVTVLERDEWSTLAKDHVVESRGAPVLYEQGSLAFDDYFMRSNVRGLFTGIKKN